ncbi:MAG: hypothetical protein KAV44_00305 [Bacteroidales bacterium]|nr:hypothetical protein [Bacteroidales bacterium]
MQNFKSLLFLVIAFIISTSSGYTQPLIVTDNYLILNATASDPLYTTYTAAMERSRMYGDKGYKMDYYNDNNPLNYSSDQAGRFFNVWMINKLVIDNIGKYFKKPVVTASFPDMAILEYEPFEGLKVQECFFVYSSAIAIVDITIKNTSDKIHTIEVFPILELGNDSLLIIDYDPVHDGYILNHYESPKRLISNLHTKFGYPTQARDFFTVSFNPYSYGGYKGDLDVFYNYIKTDFYDENRKNDSLNFQKSGYTDFVSFQYKFNLKPGKIKNFRYFRGWQAQDENLDDLIKKIEKLKNESLQKYVDKDVKLFKSAPHINFKTKDEKLVYIGALNLARGCMLPPSGKTKYNFYAFSRQPLWGWGHGHQVLHESLSMMAYVYLDPESAQNSQRIYIEQQGNDGLIAYRHGPRGPQTYPHKGKPTTSAPFYSWINWEVYKVSKDEIFLKDAYGSGKKYVNWLIKNRDVDQDGTFEWGPYGIIENVRDWYNAVFQVSADRYLDVDKEDISDELECLDLTLMVVKEMRCLAKMAEELGKKKEAKKWTKNADKISELVNELMWDEDSEFYYSINKKDHSFFFMDRDLKRQEIIGFLALWAEAAPKDRAEKLIKILTDTTKFWRKYGVPTLAADDEWYSPYVDYCCKWNGPVWLLWDYMVFDGLVNYGYYDLAKQLADKMMLAVSTQLSKNHNFWESFSPDNEVLNCPSNYIWDSIMAKLLIEVDLLKSTGKVN